MFNIVKIVSKECTKMEGLQRKSVIWKIVLLLRGNLCVPYNQ